VCRYTRCISCARRLSCFIPAGGEGKHLQVRRESGAHSHLEVLPAWVGEGQLLDAGCRCAGRQPDVMQLQPVQCQPCNCLAVSNTF